MFTPFHAGDQKSNVKVSAGLSSLRKLHVPLASGGLPRLQPHASIPASGHRPPPPLSAAPRRLQSPHLATTAVPAGPKHQPHLWTYSCVLLATGRLAHARYGSRHWGHGSAQSRHPHPGAESPEGAGDTKPAGRGYSTLLLLPAAPAPPSPPPGAAPSLCPCVCLLSVSTSVSRLRQGPRPPCTVRSAEYSAGTQ